MKILPTRTVKVLSSDIEVDPIRADMYPMPVNPEAMRDGGSNVTPDNGSQAAETEIEPVNVEHAEPVEQSMIPADKMVKNLARRP